MKIYFFKMSEKFEKQKYKIFSLAKMELVSVLMVLIDIVKIRAMKYSSDC